MVDIVDIYREYIEKENSHHLDKYKGYENHFSASSSGLCYKKNLYKSLNYPIDTSRNPRIDRLMRLGTVVHKDLEEAIRLWISRGGNMPDMDVFIEEQVIIPKWNVIGHLDFATYDRNDNSLYVCDYKTAGWFKWSQRIVKELDESINYNLQLATYTIGLMDKYDFQDANVRMDLMWYKKDTSAIKFETIDNDYLFKAADYWENMNSRRYKIETLKKGISDGVPFYKWECKNCPYLKTCEQSLLE